MKDQEWRETTIRALVFSVLYSLWPMVNLTIKNERKKITAIAFVPDSIVFRDFVVTRHPSTTKAAWCRISIRPAAHAWSDAFVHVRTGSTSFVLLRPSSRFYAAGERPNDSLQRAESQSGSVRRMIVAPWGRTRARVPFCDHMSGELFDTILWLRKSVCQTSASASTNGEIQTG